LVAGLLKLAFGWFRCKTTLSHPRQRWREFPVAAKAGGFLPAALNRSRRVTGARVTSPVWQNETEASVRRNLAFQIGRLTALIQKRDEQVQQAKYSNRYLRTEDVPKIFLNYASKAPGNTVVTRLVNQATSVEDRAITVTGKA
jgi:hypothetical protein